MIRRSLIALAFTALAACATTETTQMEACPASGCVDPKAPPTGPAPTEHLRKQAAFDLQCDAAKLSWTQLGEEKWYSDVRAWGVRGCGKQASYALEPRCGVAAYEICNWILNSPVQPTQ